MRSIDSTIKMAAIEKRGLSMKLVAKKWRRLFALLAGVFLVLVVVPVVYQMVRGPRMTISRETTYITEPLDVNGYPDYAAWLNRELSAGVTPDNNATVLLLQAVGPAVIRSELRERYWKLLGIEPLPEKGDYFVELEVAARQSQPAHITPVSEKTPEEAANQTLDEAMKRPWSKEEFPLLARWLLSNERPLSLVVEASKRPRFFEPIVVKAKGTLLESFWSASGQTRPLGRALVARAMLKLHDGDVPAAWSDLQACHRLGRLVGQNPSLVGSLLGITLDGFANQGDIAVLRQRDFTSAHLERMRRDLEQLPPMSRMIDKLNIGERFTSLDCVVLMAREGPASLPAGEKQDPKPKGPLDSLKKWIDRSSLDYDLILGMCNHWCDRNVEALDKHRRADRVAAIRKIDADISGELHAARNWPRMLWNASFRRREAGSEAVGLIMASLLLPSASAANEAQDRWIMNCELTKLAFALAAYRADHGDYPEKLAELAPKYIKEVPKDMFNNDADLHYQRQDGGYLL